MINKYLNKKNKGFTVIELLLYLAIFSMLLVVMFQLFTAIIDVQLESSGSSSVDQDGLYILSRFTRDIQRANSITTPVASSSASTLAVVISGDTLTFAQASSNLTLSDAALGTSNQLNGEGTTISNLLFSRLASSQSAGLEAITISFRLTGKAKARSGQEVKDFKTTIGIRKP